ncbi:MAG: hypothetical protein ABW275_06530 [Hansschlegelia sp.]
MVRLVGAALAVAIAVSPASAVETGGCGKFKWPVEADIALLANAKNLKSGGRLDVSAPVAVHLVLGPVADAGFDLPPERAPAATAAAGVARFDAQAGVYQVTLTDAAWTDLVQNGRPLKPLGFSGVSDCEGARKSLRYELSAGPATLQVSNSPTRVIGVAISPAGK